MRSSRRIVRLATTLAIVGIARLPGFAQGIAPYKADDIQPYNGTPAAPQKPSQPAKPGPAQPSAKRETASPVVSPRTGKPAPQPAKPAAAGNLVEPLANGLQLSWTAREIKNAFGGGTAGWDARTITYPGFRVAVGGPEERIWHLHLTGADAGLNCGIRPGSSKADVERVFGHAHRATYGQYQLTFEYNGDRVIDIGIDPANGDFVPFAKTTARPAPPTKPAAVSILGPWWGVQSMTQIDVKADGTYTSPNGARGTWQMTGEDIVFTGPLGGWNDGRAKLTKGGWIEFLWKDKSGAAYLFQLVRR